LNANILKNYFPYKIFLKHTPNTSITLGINVVYTLPEKVSKVSIETNDLFENFTTKFIY
jgi:hypothetical protein